MASSNEVIVRRFFDDLWNTGNLAVTEELVADEHVHHLGDEELRGPDGVKGAVVWLRTAFPDLRFRLDDVVVDDDRVAVRWTATGTHLGPLSDLSPTGRHVTWTGADWIRLASGRIVELWAITDGGALREQLTASD